MKYLVIVILSLLYVLPNISAAQEEVAGVCFTEKQAIDIITLLDASERDIQLLGSCQKLVKDLYTQLEDRDDKIVTLTEGLIEAKQQVIEYKLSAQRWRKVSLYTGIGAAILLAIEILPRVL